MKKILFSTSNSKNLFNEKLKAKAFIALKGREDGGVYWQFKAEQ